MPSRTILSPAVMVEVQSLRCLDGGARVIALSRNIMEGRVAYRRLLALPIAALVATAAAHAAQPPSRPQYRVSLAPPGYANGQDPQVSAFVQMWIDTTNTSVNAWGEPTPISDQSPMPVVVKSGSPSAPGYSVAPDVPLMQQTLAMGTVGNAVTFNVPSGVGTLETYISGLTASGGTVGFKATPISGGPYATFAAQGGSAGGVLGDYTSFSTDGSATIDTAGHVQIQLVVLTAGTGSVTVAGDYAASVRNMNVRVVGSVTTADGTDPASPQVANPGTGARGWLGGALAALGTQSDAAWVSGNGTAISLYKAIIAKQPTLTTPGTPASGSNGITATVVPATGGSPFPTVGLTGQSQVTPTVGTGTSRYAQNYVIGGMLTFPGIVRSGATSGMVQKALVGFADAQTPSLDLELFNANPTGSATTDGAMFSVVAVDRAKSIGTIHISDCTADNTTTGCQALNLALSYAGAASGGPLYGVLINRGAMALTLASTSDVTVTITGPQD